MVATPVIGATYSDQYGNADLTITGNVPLVIGHKMTQVNFTVKLNAPVNDTEATAEGTTATTYTTNKGKKKSSSSFSVQFSHSVFSNLCEPVDCSTSGFPVCHQLPELAQTHVH